MDRVGVKYPLEFSTEGNLSKELELPIERVISVLLTKQGERPFHPEYGSPAPIFSILDRDDYALPAIEGVDTSIEVLLGGLIVNARLI